MYGNRQPDVQRWHNESWKNKTDGSTHRPGSGGTGRRHPKAEQTQTCVGVEELKGLTPFSLAAAVLVVLGTAPRCPRELLPAEAPTPLCRHSPGCARFPHTRDSSSGRGPRSFRSTLPRQRTNLCSWGCSPAWDSDGSFLRMDESRSRGCCQLAKPCTNRQDMSEQPEACP